MFSVTIPDGITGELPDVPDHVRGGAEVRVTVRVIQSTGKAYLIERADNPQGRTWVPSSQVIRLNERFPNTRIAMPDWLWARVRTQI